MNADYDSDGGDHVTYRHHEKGLHMGQQAGFSDEFQISLWSKKKGKLNSRNEDDAKITFDERYSFQLSQDLIGTTETKLSTHERIIPVNVSTELHEYVDDQFHQPSKRIRANIDNNKDLDLPAHWRISNSKVPQKPRSRLQNPQSIPSTTDARFSATGTTSSKISRPQPLAFTTAALPLSSNTIGNSSSSTMSLVPSKPSWLPQVSLLSKKTSTPHVPQQEDIVDESFDTHPEHHQNNIKISLNHFHQKDLDQSIVTDTNTYDPPIESAINSYAPPRTSNSTMNESHKFLSPSKSKNHRNKVGSLRWKFEKIVRDSSNLENYLSSSDLASVMLDPRGRVNFHFKSSVNKVIGFIAPFIALRIFINTFDNPVVFKDKSTANKTQLNSTVSSDDINGVYHALVLLKPNGAQEVKLRNNASPDIVLFDPFILNASKVSSNEQLLHAFVRGEGDGISMEKLFVCSVWEIV